MRLLWKLVVSNLLGILAFFLVLLTVAELLAGHIEFSLFIAIPAALVAGVGAFMLSFVLLSKER